MKSYIILIAVLILLTGCNAHDQVFSEVESVIDEHPDSAYAILSDIDTAALSNDAQQARYALLFTKAQYKTYIDAPDDSLISVAVEYIERHGSNEEKFYAYLYQGIIRYWIADYHLCTISLLKAMKNCNRIDDHYSKGQMYTYLALANSSQHCSDDMLYARKAYQEYSLGNLDDYMASALTTLANAKLHAQEDDSCLYYLDKAILIAQRQGNAFVLNDALSLKLQCYICSDSLNQAEDICMRLKSTEGYRLSARDLSNLAVVYAGADNPDSVAVYLNQARIECRNDNDIADFFVKAYWANRYLHNDEVSAAYQDSLLIIEEQVLNESIKHTSLAAQRDYIEEQLLISELENRKLVFTLCTLFILLMSFSAVYYFEGQKRKMYIQLQADRIRHLQSAIEQQRSEYTESEQSIKNDPFVAGLLSSSDNMIMTKDNWSTLNALFRRYLPHFKIALDELITLSEIEWRVCMLLKLGVSPGNIANLTNKSPGAISSIRERLYKKVFGKKGSTKEWDDFVRSL